MSKTRLKSGQDPVEGFRSIASNQKGWEQIGDAEKIYTIRFFGDLYRYILGTGAGEEEYYSLCRSFGWCVVFGVTGDEHVITLVQWKPGTNVPNWELPPGGIGKIDSSTTEEEFLERTKASFLKETGYGGGKWKRLNKAAVESGKYRGTKMEDQGFFAHMYLATDLEFIQDARSPNLNEIIDILEVPLADFRKVMECPDFREVSAKDCAYQALLELGMIKWV